ncbi:MAG: hypothetical protein HGB31_06260 [Erysipelotrichaceae bacterium]|nr:hypothetical protein [Erysipelotrichaceae bacterium]
MKISGSMKKVLEILFIVLAGFVLFNVAFIMAALVIQGLGFLSQSETQNPRLGMIFGLILLGLSWFILRSRLSTLVKATYFTMPLMSMIVVLGVLMNGLQLWMILACEGLLIGVVFGFIRMKRLAWEYHFATLYCTVIGISIIIFNIQI